MRTKSTLEERCGFTAIECEILWERREPNFIKEGEELKPPKKSRERYYMDDIVMTGIAKSNRENEQRIINSLWPEDGG